jgi:phenylacetate-CoA ligase
MLTLFSKLYWYTITKKNYPSAFRKRINLESEYLKSSKEIKKLQIERLKKILNYAMNKSSYYSDLMKRESINIEKIKTINDWSNIPVLKKTDVQNNLDKMLSTDFKKSMVFEDATGGSTGQPLIFFYDTSSKNWSVACDIFVMKKWGVNPWDKKAFLWGADKDIPDWNRREKIKIKFERAEILNSFLMNEKRMMEYAKLLTKWKPDYIQGYASSLYSFAAFLLKNNINAPKPKAIRSSAESLHLGQRDLIEKVFGSKVYNFYGSREITNIAWECDAHMGMHTFAPLRYVEIVDDNGNIKANNEPGKIVITDFINHAMPFIRYEIGDIGIMSDKYCSCGCNFPLLKEVMGRETDFIQTKDGKLIHGEYFTHLFYGIRGISQFQVHQKNLDLIKISIIENDKIDGGVLKEIKSKIEARIGIGTIIKIDLVDKLPLPMSGKLRFTISDVPVKY